MIKGGKIAKSSSSRCCGYNTATELLGSHQCITSSRACCKTERKKEKRDWDVVKVSHRVLVFPLLHHLDPLPSPWCLLSQWHAFRNDLFCLHPHDGWCSHLEHNAFHSKPCMAILLYQYRRTGMSEHTPSTKKSHLGFAVHHLSYLYLWNCLFLFGWPMVILSETIAFLKPSELPTKAF